MQCACAVLCCHMWTVRLYNIFPHYLINGTIFEKKSFSIKCVLIFSTNLSETFFILKTTESDMSQIYTRLHAKYPLFLSDLKETWISRQIWEKYSNVRVHENLSSCSCVFHADLQTDMTKVIVAFRNFKNADQNSGPRKSLCSNSQKSWIYII